MIPYTKPSITQKEIDYVNDAITNGWGEHCYDYIHRFENAFKEYIGVKYAISTSSCTGALHMGLSAIGIGYDDEVILADSNWIATVAPITYLKATPVFVDILPDTWCIDTKLAKEAINSHTKAIIATHLYGNLCDMGALLKIGKTYNIPVIEDAAEAIGSEYHGKKAGSMGKFGVFSFHGTKTMTTGEGGMFVTNDEELYEKVLTLSNHGRSKTQTKQFYPDVIGYKYKMSNIQAALGCAQLERIDELVKRKQEILEYYRNKLEIMDGVYLNPIQVNTVNGAWMPTVYFKDVLSQNDIKKLFVEFKKAGIDARVFFHPLSSLPMFQSDPEWILMNTSMMVSLFAINLPSYHDLTDEDQDKVIEVIRRVYETAING